MELMIVLIALLVVLMYFLLTSPNRQEQEKKRHKINTLHQKALQAFDGYICAKRSGDSKRATREELKKHITTLFGLNVGLGEEEILGLAMVIDEIDYRFALGLMFYPSPIDYLEQKIMGELPGREKEGSLLQIINALGDCDPALKGRIKTLYKDLNCRQYLPCWRYLNQVVGTPQLIAV